MDTSPVIDPVPSLATRLSLSVRTWAFKIVLKVMSNLARLLLPSAFRQYSPTYTKTYPVRRTLECRVFIPKSHVSGTRHPLYIDMHGGGYMAGRARTDDKFCHYIANTFGHIVVSLSYHLAPMHPFPVGVDDCTALTLAILADTDLPIDIERVAMGGQSAGGGLALSVAQDSALRERIKALVIFYAPTDFSRRCVGPYRDKPADAEGRGGAKDMSRPFISLLEWAYVPYGHDRTDPRLSPVYASRKLLPMKMFFVGAHYDKLCGEAFETAKRLAGDLAMDKTEEESWDINGVRWERLEGALHGFIEEAWRAELFRGYEEDLPWKKNVASLLERVKEWLDDVHKPAR